MPTRTEIETLLDNTKVTCEWTTNGRRFTDEGTGKSIFLPASGLIGSGGSVFLVGSWGCFWSSNSVNSATAYSFVFDEATTFTIAPNNYYCGYSIRPVKDGTIGINIVSADTENTTVTGYFDILGRKLKEEPTAGIYIIQYENGTAKKVMR